MTDDRTAAGPPKRTLIVVLAVLSATVAIAAVVIHLWLTAIGSSLTAAAMVGSFWSTRPRRGTRRPRS